MMFFFYYFSLFSPIFSSPHLFTEATLLSDPQFSKVHGMSSLANLVTLVCTIAHGTWLAGLLV